MLHKISVAVVFAALISTNIAAKVSAASLTESVDVGDFLFNSGKTDSQPAGTSLDSISGSLGDGDNIDLYQIYLPGGGFSASVIGTGQDTQLFLFDANGIGVIASNDPNFPDFQPNIPTTNLTAGTYYFGISIAGFDPQSSGGAIFNFLVADPTGPNGPGPGASVSSWSTGFSPDSEGYSINLSGAQFVGPSAAAAVPFDFNPIFGVGMLGIWAGWNYLKRRKSPDLMHK